MKIIDAVSAVFCHGGQVFAVRRQKNLQMFPGYESFPGGKVETEDLERRYPAQFLDRLDGRNAHALVREIREELDYDLPAAIGSGQVANVRLLGTSLAPSIIPFRFYLHYYRIDLNSRPSFTLDSGELERGVWKTPHQLLDDFEQGESLTVPPFRRIMAQLLNNPQGADFGDLSPLHDETRFVPEMAMLGGVRVLPVPSRTFPPLRRTNAFLFGDEGSPRILVDPSPESSAVMRKLIETLRNDPPAAIFITHHHPDHHEHAPDMARYWDVPLLMSADTRARILDRWGIDYFQQARVDICREGDQLTRWKGEPVSVYEIPGHDAGHLALAPESLRWFLVGDLVQNFGTVVISAPEGDMSSYFATLEKVIALDPAVILPSHGMPLRGTYMLRAALRHRRRRERLIHELHRAGQSNDQILAKIYQQVEPELLPLAMRNIESHLVKLRREGRV